VGALVCRGVTWPAARRQKPKQKSKSKRRPRRSGLRPPRATQTNKGQSAKAKRVAALLACEDFVIVRDRVVTRRSPLRRACNPRPGAGGGARPAQRAQGPAPTAPTHHRMRHGGNDQQCAFQSSVTGERGLLPFGQLVSMSKLLCRTRSVQQAELIQSRAWPRRGAGRGAGPGGLAAAQNPAQNEKRRSVAPSG